MMIDHVALLPVYVAAGTAVLVLLADVLAGRRAVTAAVAALGAAATAGVAWWGGLQTAGTGVVRATFCAGGSAPGDGAPADCSLVATPVASAVAVLFALLTLGVLALSVPVLRAGTVPAGEYLFLLACSMTGGVVIGYAGDLITLIVALETLTLPLYVLVGSRRRALVSAEGAITFFVISVVSTAVTLLGAALLYAATGAVHLRPLGALFARDPALADTPLVVVAASLIVAGLGFKVAAVPFHAWAPAAYDGAPLPVAAYLSTASKLGGVIAILAVVGGVLPVAVTGPVLAALAVLTMTVGNLVALRQTRMVRLLAWSSVAQAGYLLAPLGALASTANWWDAAAATVGYTIFYVVIELGAFAAVVALRGTADGGTIRDYAGAARRMPAVGAVLALALVGLAGLPPGLAGLFAKVTIVRSLLGGGAGWLAVVVALNAVIGLAYYIRVTATLYTASAGAPVPVGGAVGVGAAVPARAPWAVTAALAAVTVVAIVIGFAPQLVLDVAALTAP